MAWRSAADTSSATLDLGDLDGEPVGVQAGLLERGARGGRRVTRLELEDRAVHRYLEVRSPAGGLAAQPRPAPRR